MPKGVIVYKGPSLLDGQPIVCIATFASLNAKTGPMVQTWILREDVSPTVAVKTGQDSSVCGRCPHRHFSGGGCYVVPFQAPSSVFKQYHLGKYDPLGPKVIKRFLGQKIRLGSYGDPAAVPYYVWLGLVGLCDGHTGYTHQIDHDCFDLKLLEFCQVSVDTVSQFKKVQDLNCGTFRVVAKGQKLLPQEVMCRNESHGDTCIQCGMCDGRHQHKIAIHVHGQREGRFNKKFGHIEAKNID